MNDHQAQVIRECASGALTGAISFPEIVGRLMDIRVERYHADYSRQEITYYFPNGDSLVVATPHGVHPTAPEFSQSRVQEAIGQSQRSEHSYLDFIRKTMAAGCVGYFVQITGRQALYFGRNGECHIEQFPQSNK